jgi:hypothetical protein
VDVYSLRRERSQNFDNNAAHFNYWRNQLTPKLFSFLIGTVNGSLNNSTVTTSNIDTTNSKIIIATVSWYSSGLAANFSDSAGNTWVHVLNTSFNGDTNDVYYCINPITSVNHSFSVVSVGGGTQPSIGVMCFSGPNCVLDISQNNFGSGVQIISAAPGVVTPVASNELIVTTTCPLIATPISMGSPNFTALTFGWSPNSNVGVGIAYSIQTTISGVNPQWVWSNQNSDATAGIISFKAT